MKKISTILSITSLVAVVTLAAFIYAPQFIKSSDADANETTVTAAKGDIVYVYWFFIVF